MATPMTNDEITGRLLVLEAFTMTTLGLYLANAKDDPTYEKAGAILDFLRGASRSLAENVSQEARAFAESYSDHLADLVAQNLRVLHGEGGQSH
jgi:hypothetical protein